MCVGRHMGPVGVTFVLTYSEARSFRSGGYARLTLRMFGCVEIYGRWFGIRACDTMRNMKGEQ